MSLDREDFNQSSVNYFGKVSVGRGVIWGGQIVYLVDVHSSAMTQSALSILLDGSKYATSQRRPGLEIAALEPSLTRVASVAAAACQLHGDRILVLRQRGRQKRTKRLRTRVRLQSHSDINPPTSNRLTIPGSNLERNQFEFDIYLQASLWSFRNQSRTSCSRRLV
jgi:hypothetical protein